MKRRLSSHRVFAVLLLASLWALPASAQTVSHIQVRIVTGAVDLSAGSYVELRIYQAGRSVLRLPLTHGEAWPRDTTRVIPLTLSDALDPRGVLRYGLYYRAASPHAPAWEVAAADVDLSAGRQPTNLLLGATLSGEIDKQGELMTVERDASSMTCLSDAECDDHLTCNGRERCAPGSPGADVRGCVRGSPVACPVNQVCVEGHGCVGTSSLTPPARN